jgi:hypothetical protein
MTIRFNLQLHPVTSVDFDTGLSAHWAGTAFIVAGKWESFTLRPVQTILAVGIVMICLMRAGTNHGWDDLGVLDIR